MIELIELSQPGCNCGHCRHLPDQPPSEGGCTFTAVIKGVPRRFWTHDGGPITQGTGEQYSIRS
jgi:hypothetical protein